MAWWRGGGLLQELKHIFLKTEQQAPMFPNSARWLRWQAALAEAVLLLIVVVGVGRGDVAVTLILAHDPVTRPSRRD